MTRHVHVILLLLLVVSNLPADRPPITADEPDAGAITKWIQQLDSNHFVVRENAQSRLLQAGSDSIDALQAYVSKGGMEASLRGLAILRDVALQDHTVAFQAEAAIEALASEQATSSAQRAADVLESLHQIRTARGMKILQRLGTSFSYVGQTYDERNLGPNVIYVKLTDAYRGNMDEAAQLIDWLSDFKGIHLTLEGARFDDQWLARLARVKNLVSLRLSRISMSDRGMDYVRQMEQLRNVSVRYCKVSKAGMRVMETHPTLRAFSAFGTQIDQDEFDKMAARKPKWNTRFGGGGGFLGISGGPYELEGIMGCYVKSVEPRQAADKGGIRVNDIITKYGDEEVFEFVPMIKTPRVTPGKKTEDTPPARKPSLSELIGADAPGDRVKISLLRLGRPLVVEVELGEWP